MCRVGPVPLDYAGRVSFSAKLLCLAIGVALAGVLVYHFAIVEPGWPPNEEDLDWVVAESVCRICGSRKSETRYGKDSSRASPDVVINPTPAQSDFLEGHHDHDWALCFSDAEYSNWWIPGSKSVVHGDGFPSWTGRMPNKLTSRYNRSEGYRASLIARVASGEIDRAQLIRLMRLERVDDKSLVEVAAR